MTAPTKERALEKLARGLYEEEIKLDPGGDPPWDQLTDRERQFYGLCVEAVLSRRTLVSDATSC
jgi:hypothetical protein